MGESNYTRKKVVLLVLVVVIFGGFFYYQKLEKSRRIFKVVFMNVGQGDAALIQTESGEKTLVDCGANRAVLAALGRSLVFYDRTIDNLIITHPDLDHYGGCIDVLKYYKVKNIYTNGVVKNNDSYFKEWQKVSSGFVIKTLSVTSSLRIGEQMIKIFSPDETLYSSGKVSDNDRSIVFTFEHRGKKFLFTGDLEEKFEKLLVEKYCLDVSRSCPLDSDILKVGHHGSDGSSSELFLQRVSPETAVISVGKNKYGHPGLRAIRHLERVGAEIFSTDKVGDVVVK